SKQREQDKQEIHHVLKAERSANLDRLGWRRKRSGGRFPPRRRITLETPAPSPVRTTANSRARKVRVCENLVEESQMPTDIEIARAAKMKPIAEIAAELGIPGESLEPYGRFKAKVQMDWIKQQQGRDDGKLILVTAINPTP